MTQLHLTFRASKLGVCEALRWLKHACPTGFQGEECNTEMSIACPTGFQGEDCDKRARRARTSSSRWRMALKASSSEPMWLRTACVSSYLATARSHALLRTFRFKV